MKPKTEEIPDIKISLKRFKRLFLIIRPYWGRLIKGVSLSIIIGLLGMVIPYLTKLLIDKVYVSEDINLMHVLVAGILAVSISTSIISTIQGYFNLYVNSKLSSATALMFFNHIQHLKTRFFDEHRTGEIMARFGDVSSSLSSINRVIQTVFVNGIYLFLVPPFLFLLNWKLAVTALISIPFTVVIITLTGRFLRKYWKRSSEAYADLNAYQVEMLTHIRSLKAMVLEKHVYNEAAGQLKNALQLQLKAGSWGQLLSLSNGILYALNTALFTWLGWTYILNNSMTLGDYIAFTAYIGYLYNPIREFVNLFSEFQHSSVNLSRTFEYLDSEPEQDPSWVYSSVDEYRPIINNSIEIRNLSFGYYPDNRILHDINLAIKAGTIMSIVGPSGSGKTSLLKLFNGMEKPVEGGIFFDGIPMEQIDISTLRKNITIVWQEFSMYKGSILDNLIIGTENVEKNIIDNALRIAQMDKYVYSLPEGLKTPIAEWGATLSGGQRQRLAIARSIIRNTPVIILDESTSNIDMKTEREILDNLFLSLRGKTIIYVTHRISSATLADKICLLENGKVTDFGTHLELINRCENYIKLFESNPEKEKFYLKSFNA